MNVLFSFKQLRTLLAMLAMMFQGVVECGGFSHFRTLLPTHLP